jgi:hypothetical protein
MNDGQPSVRIGERQVLASGQLAFQEADGDVVIAIGRMKLILALSSDEMATDYATAGPDGDSMRVVFNYRWFGEAGAFVDFVLNYGADQSRSLVLAFYALPNVATGRILVAYTVSASPEDAAALS